MLALTPHSRRHLPLLASKAPTCATSLPLLSIARITRCSKKNTTTCEHHTI